MKQFVSPGKIFGQVAQSVEQRTENPCVDGSIPSLATLFSPRFLPWAGVLAVMLAATGCSNPCAKTWNDKCERVCCETADMLQSCKSDAWSWQDLGASNRDDFAQRCFGEWDDLSDGLNSHEEQLAIQVCIDTRPFLDPKNESLTCDELVAQHLSYP